MSSFDQAIAGLDLELFAKVNSQSTEHDKRSLLAIQLAVRNLRPSYNYLEIGSHLGGSIQPHLIDHRCARIYSIDKRPPQQPDAGGVDYRYLNNSTERMLERLREVAPESMAKLTAIDDDSRSIDPKQISERIDLCFIDGEHTDEAVRSDFRFCLDILGADGCITFHDAQIVYNGLADCIDYLKERGKPFHAYCLPSTVFVIELGEFPIHREPAVTERLLNNYQSYLHALQSNDYYRRFANKYPFRKARSFVSWVRGEREHVSD